MASHHELGKKGELIAQHYLLEKGFRVLHTNWRQGRREIDIIAFTAGCLVFFEVKTRANDLYGWPEQKVNVDKRRCLQAAAAVYLEKMPRLPPEIRFDIISITFRQGEQYELVHIEDAF